MADPRVGAFLKLDNSKKMPWQERVKLINETFPSTVQLDWQRAFSDVDLYGRILRDILKVDQTEPGRSGPRPVLDREKATERLRQFMGADFTERPFAEAFRNIAGGRSVRWIAAKTGLNFMMVQRLVTGERAPDLMTIEQVAAAFKKDPAYFIEYRVAYVLAALGDRLAGSPELTVDLYKRIKTSGK